MFRVYKYCFAYLEVVAAILEDESETERGCGKYIMLVLALGVVVGVGGYGYRSPGGMAVASGE